MFHRIKSFNPQMEAAIKANNVLEVRQIAESDRDSVDKAINQDLTPLGLAAYRGYADIVAELLMRGADPHRQFNPPGQFSKCTPVEVAERRGHDAVIAVFHSMVPSIAAKAKPKTKTKPKPKPKKESEQETKDDWEHVDAKAAATTATATTATGVVDPGTSGEFGPGLGEPRTERTQSESTDIMGDNSLELTEALIKAQKDLSEMGRLYTATVTQNEELRANLVFTEQERTEGVDRITQLTTTLNQMHEDNEALQNRVVSLESQIGLLNWQSEHLDGEKKRSESPLAVQDGAASSPTSSLTASPGKAVALALAEASAEGNANETDDAKDIEIRALRRMLAAAQRDVLAARAHAFDDIIDILATKRKAMGAGLAGSGHRKNKI